jgi:hypothetical protein
VAENFRLNATGTFVLQSAGGATLHTVNVDKAGATSTVTLYDNTAASGTVIAVIDTSAAGLHTFDTPLVNGLTAVVTATAPDVTIVLQ